MSVFKVGSTTNGSVTRSVSFKVLGGIEVQARVGICSSDKFFLSLR